MPAEEAAAGARPPARPRLLPETRWARWALALLLLFVLARGVAFAVTIPAFWGPDEDYHFLYAEYITTQHALIDPDEPLYPREYSVLAELTKYDDYGPGARSDFSGDPKDSVRELERLPDGAREPFEEGRGIGVVHPPLYPLMGAAVNGALGDASLPARLTAVRIMTSFLGVAAVYAAWLLAAQVLSRFRFQILAAFLVAVQPMVAYESGVVNHDMALIAFFSAALAMMLFLVRTPPRAAQGAWLALPVVLALFVKGTALVLLPLAALALLAQGLTWRPQWRTALRSALVAFGIVALVAGWWYVRSKVLYGSATGATEDVVVGTSINPSLGDYIDFVRRWTLLTYRTYWFHYVFFETPNPSLIYFTPMAVGIPGVLGLLVALLGERRALFDPARPLLRQAVLVVAAALLLYLPLLWLDVSRASVGQDFFVNGGRYLLPAFAGVAALAVVGLRRLSPPRAEPYVMLGLAVVATVFFIEVFRRFYLERYFGEGTPSELLRRVSFDKPEWVTPFSLTLLLSLVGASLIAFAVAARRSASA